MFNRITVPPKLLLRALEDLNALAETARRLPELERWLESVVLDLRGDIAVMREAVEPLVGRMDGLAREMSPIQQLSNVHAAISPLEGQLEAMSGKLDGLREEMAPIQELPALRGDIGGLSGELEAMSGKLDGLREEMAPIQELPAMRQAVEPLGAKMEDLKAATNDLEPMLREVCDAVRSLVPKLEEVREAIGPVGDVVDNLPKFMKN